MFLDQSASHLIITTTLGENFYLHTQSRQPKPLSRLKGVSIECIAWNPSLPTASTREILIGVSDGNVYEVYIEPSQEFYRREDKYLKSVYKIPDGPVTGLWADLVPGKSDFRKVLVASHGRLLHFMGRIGRSGDSGGSVYPELFQKEAPTVHEVGRANASAPSVLVVSPDSAETSASASESETVERSYAWLSSIGVFYGRIPSFSGPNAGNKLFNESKMLPRSMFPASESARGGRKMIQDPIMSVTLSPWHVLALVEGRVIAVNRLNEEIVYDQVVLEPGQSALGVLTDQKKNTFWLFTGREIYEIVASDEDRDIWKIMLQNQQFDAALKYARGATQKDSVATASGDYLASQGKFLEAAGVWGKSSKPFEEVCLSFIDQGEQDALRKYLLTKLGTYKKSSIMQRTMIAIWLVEIFMSKLDSLDDTITTKAEVSEASTPAEIKGSLETVRSEFQDFTTRYKSDLDSKTVYEVISSHGREEELLTYATVINDYGYILSYWIQREKWTEALDVLKKQTDPEVFYKYSSVLMTHVAPGLIDVLMRQTALDPQKLIPALLSYNEAVSPSLQSNQAIRYLTFLIANHPSPSASIHNTLISLYAASPSPSETALLSYLESQPHPPPYDADFALRLCTQHSRVQSCVHIYTSMSQYQSAVELALAHNDRSLAAIVANRPFSNPPLRKKLWLLIAQAIISPAKTTLPATSTEMEALSIKSAITFLKQCELLKIEDLIPFFPDFVVIDDFRDEICTALEEYSRHIDALHLEMDASATTAAAIKSEIAALDTRYAIVEPGEKCWICGMPVLARQFFVFPCQHAFHSDCLGRKVLEGAGMGKRKKIRDLQGEVSRGVGVGDARKRDRLIRELDGLVGEACILCGEHAIKMLDEPFVAEGEDKGEWAL
jgi:vacuolar protein sorting-associated protein 18